MRFISGIVIGVALTIGTAYVHDMLYAPASLDSAVARPMVNWDTVGVTARRAVDRVRMQWDRLSAR